jgi:hypothetical protein
MHDPDSRDISRLAPGRPNARGRGMRVAFCFLTRGDLLQPAVWETFFAGADREQHAVYSHPKEPVAVTSPVLGGTAIPERVPTRYGDVSLVKATLNLFTHAYHDSAENEYFVLLSESTIPIVPFSYFLAGLQVCRPRSVIRYKIPNETEEHHARLYTVKRRALFEPGFFYHHQWVILHRRHVALLLDHPGLDLFQYMFAPDEHYFMNVLVHLHGVQGSEILNINTTFVNWMEREQKTHRDPATGLIQGHSLHPKTYSRISPADLALAREQNCWFFRKVAAECDCTLVIDELKRQPMAA